MKVASALEGLRVSVSERVDIGADLPGWGSGT